MKSSNRFALLATVVAALGTLSSAAIAATASGTATATVIAPITINSTTALNFGSFSNANPGTVTISTAGARTASGVLLSGTNTGLGGIFTVGGSATGTPGFSITSPQGFSVTGPGTAMPFTLTLPGATGTLSGGAATIAVGGVLTVGTAQTAGAYSGSYSVVVEYN